MIKVKHNILFQYGTIKAADQMIKNKPNKTSLSFTYKFIGQKLIKKLSLSIQNLWYSSITSLYHVFIYHHQVNTTNLLIKAEKIQSWMLKQVRILLL